MPVKILKVNDDNDGRRIDNYLMSIYKEIPKSKIYSIIRKGEVRVNSGRVKPNSKISSGDLIRIPPYLNEDRNGPKHKVNTSLKTLVTKNIIFEDNNFIIINKPYGIAVHGGTKNNIGIIDVVRSIYDDSIDLCHRIDKETSGCLVLSKNKKSNKWFNKLLLDKKIKKKYIAILKGHLNSTKEIKSLINTTNFDDVVTFGKQTGKSLIITRGEHGSIAIIKDEVVECNSKKNLKIRDLTGAGDLFAAGFLAEYIRSQDLESSGKEGVKMASIIIQQFGARV